MTAPDDRFEPYRREVEEYYRRFVAGGFGETRLTFYGDEIGALPAAVRNASLACGNPVKHLLAAGDARLAGRLLDLGCGGGMDLCLAASRGRFDLAVGIDRSAGMIGKAAESRAHYPDRRIALARSDAETLPFRDGVFAAVISNAAINLVPDKARAFAEVRRVLADDGAFFLSDVAVLSPIPEAAKGRFGVMDGLYFAPTLIPWEEELVLLRREFDLARLIATVDILADATHVDRLLAGRPDLPARDRKFIRKGLMKGKFRVIEVEARPVLRGQVDAIPCPCGVRVDCESHQTIDLDASPRLFARLLDGTLNRLDCRACGFSAQLPAPVLALSDDLSLHATLLPGAMRAMVDEIRGQLPAGEEIVFSGRELMDRHPELARRMAAFGASGDRRGPANTPASNSV